MILLKGYCRWKQSSKEVPVSRLVNVSNLQSWAFWMQSSTELQCLTPGAAPVTAAVVVAAASRQCRPASERQRAAPARSTPAPLCALPPCDARLRAGARPSPSEPGLEPSQRSHWFPVPGARDVSRGARFSHSCGSRRRARPRSLSHSPVAPTPTPL